MRVVFVNRFYSPDLSATSQILTDLAEALAGSGVSVAIVCSRQLYENPGAALPPREQIRGVSVHRVAGSSFGRRSLPGRALDYATFYLTAAITLLRIVRKSDLLVVKTDPPLFSLIGAVVAACKGARLVNWLQDVFPEVASRLSLSPLPRPLEALLRTARDRSLTTARVNVVLGTGMRDYLISRGIAPGRIVISENWADENAVYPLPAADSALRRSLGLADRFVVAYSGNLGRAHDADTILRAAQLSATDPDLIFLMIGGGANMRLLESRAREQGLTNFRFAPYQPRTALADALAAGDVHLVSLLPQMEGLIFPSKLYGILAAGRPVVFVGDPEGELSRVVRESDIGLSVAANNASGLLESLWKLREDTAMREGMCSRARELFERRYTLKAAVVRWQDVLARAASSSARSA